MQSNRFQQYLDRYLGIPLCLLLSLFCRRARVLYTPKKILFIQLSALGDTILAVPTIRAIRHTFPAAEITMLASRTNLDYLANCPYIDRRIRFQMRMHRLLTPLRRERFDWVIDLEHWPRLSALLAYATGAPGTDRVSDERTAPPFPLHRYSPTYPRTARSPELLGHRNRIGVSGPGIQS